MKLTVNDAIVQMAYLAFEEPNSGHILEILVAEEAISGIHFGPKEPSLHVQIVRALDIALPSGGLMDRAETESGFSEIRILGGMMLEAIDMMRRAGLGVKETI